MLYYIEHYNFNEGYYNSGSLLYKSFEAAEEARLQLDEPYRYRVYAVKLKGA